DFYDLNQEPLDADGDGQVDPGKLGYAHTDNNTWARTTPIFFQAAEERSRATASCDAFVTFNASGSASPEQAVGGVDGGIQGDQEYATADSDADFHCNDYDGPPAFVDAVTFRATPEGTCTDMTPPVPVCPGNVTVASDGPSGLPVSDAAVQAFLSSVTVTDSV